MPGILRDFFWTHKIKAQTFQKTREGCGCPKFLAGKVFRQISTLLENSSPIFPAAQNAIPAKVWAFSGKDNGCWKIGRACGNAAGFSPPRPPQPS